MIYLPSNYSERELIERLGESLHAEVVKAARDYEYVWRMYQIYEGELT